MNRDDGIAEQVVIASVGVVGTVAAGAPMVVLAVSEEAARNAQFGAAVIAAILGFGAILGWFARLGLQAMRKLDALDSLRDDVKGLHEFAASIAAQQVTLTRYEADRAADRAEAERIFAAAEANRIAAEKSGITGLLPLPYKQP